MPCVQIPPPSLGNKMTGSEAGTMKLEQKGIEEEKNKTIFNLR
jgi:hypothetical protein